VSEQRVENEQCLATYGRTPVQVLEDAGALGARFCAVHATHVDEAGVASLGASGSTVCLCPTTERDLADGIGPAGRLASAGARLAVGSDSQAVVDGFEEIRAVELDERLATGVRGTFGAPALVDALAPHGHRALGWPDAGRLAVGSRADLVTVSLDSVRLAGCDESALLDTVLFSATAADVTDVTVDGVDVVVDRCHARIDVASELRAAVAEVGAERP